MQEWTQDFFQRGGGLEPFWSLRGEGGVFKNLGAKEMVVNRRTKVENHRKSENRVASSKFGHPKLEVLRLRT